MANRLGAVTIFGMFILSTAGAASAQQTLAAVKQRGEVLCGVGEGSPGFFSPDDKGVWHGLDVDVCRALSAAIFGSPDKVKFLPATPSARFAQLQSGQVDLLSRSVTWTFSRDASLGIDFPTVAFYDGHGFMVKKSLGVSSAKDLNGANICTQSGLSTEVIVADYFRQNNLTYRPVVFEKVEETLKAFEQGRCDVFSSDKSTLFSYRARLGEPDAYIVLPETISRTLDGPAVRHGDNNWGDIVRWTLFAMIGAEDLGVSSANVDQMKASSTNAEIRRLIGVEGEFGKMLGLPNDWGYNILKTVGNYGEMYERNLGGASPVVIPRKGSLNALWRNGGLMIAPSFQ